MRKAATMPRVIHKYPIPHAGCGPIRMPKNAQCLFAREQRNQAFIWALVDPTAEMESRSFLVIETGNTTVPAGSRYLGSAMLDGGTYVLHIFEPATAVQ